MYYAVEYNKNFRYNDIIDEVIIQYNDNVVEKVEELSSRPTLSIVIDIHNKIDIENIIPILKKCYEINNNITIRSDLTDHNEALKDLNVIPYFYNIYCNTLDEVYALIKMGVYEVYITESLGFNIKEISEYCNKHNVCIRVIPNIAQHKRNCGIYIPDPYKFFIRPEDIDTYAEYIDTFELIAPPEKLSIIYEIYRNKVWDGDLNKLISGINESFPNNGIPPMFVKQRLDCKQKCMLEKCNLCKHMKEVSEMFNNNNLVIKKTKDKEWKHETESYKAAMQSLDTETSQDVGKVSEG